ncbi:DUF1648 domain-containing protein [Corynebacterium sp. zg254]|uniref:DUF1648 domain-containing protein n=1 Tax=Corynebacterium zhongnanshanii TaxID=2768834 RepID=A0ABQ6VGT2_9CORY|nr:DUF1648 domain-containing protein [Corynebacterium zhongnanshanii]MCR5913822.1 DUF1648 domain-containing protein [Corynebacterium sp. zg254]
MPLLGGLLAIAVSVLIVARDWDTIPDTVPTHWGTSMRPDSWGAKSVGHEYRVGLAGR